jgi:hypothetical protein
VLRHEADVVDEIGEDRSDDPSVAAIDVSVTTGGRFARRPNIVQLRPALVAEPGRGSSCGATCAASHPVASSDHLRACALAEVYPAEIN